MFKELGKHIDKALDSTAEVLITASVVVERETKDLSTKVEKSVQAAKKAWNKYNKK